MLKLEVTLPTRIGAAYAWLHLGGRTRQEILERAILLMVALESGEGNRCMDAVEHYGVLDPDILDELAKGAEKLACAFGREAYLARVAKGEIE